MSMTTLSDLMTEETVAQARQVRFSRVLLTLILGFFWLAGWLAGHAWLGAVMCALAVRRGWRDGTGWTPPLPPSPPRPPGQVLPGRLKYTGQQ